MEGICNGIPGIGNQKQASKISVIVKDPGKKARHVNISNTLKNLQKTVDGYIETVTIATDMVIICNEEGALQGLPYNCRLCGISFVGTIIIAGVTEDEFADLPVSFQEMKKLFPQLFYE